MTRSTQHNWNKLLRENPSHYQEETESNEVVTSDVEIGDVEERKKKKRHSFEACCVVRRRVDVFSFPNVSVG